VRTRDDIAQEIAALERELAALVHDAELAAQALRGAGAEVRRADPEGDAPVTQTQEEQ